MDPPVHASPCSPSGKMPPTLGLGTIKVEALFDCVVLWSGVDLLALADGVKCVILGVEDGDLEGIF